VTGTATPVIENIREDVYRIRRITALPLVVGFGISSPQQAGGIASLADGIVVGSAFVNLVEKNAGNENLIKIASTFVRDIKNAIT
jgi:tryptophan synthase alpha chain